MNANKETPVHSWEGIEGMEVRELTMRLGMPLDRWEAAEETARQTGITVADLLAEMVFMVAVSHVEEVGMAIMLRQVLRLRAEAAAPAGNA